MSRASTLQLWGLRWQRRWASKTARGEMQIVPGLESRDERKLPRERETVSFPSTKRKDQQKKATLDDFFANLGSARQQPKKPARRVKRYRQEQSILPQMPTTTESDTLQKVDIISFFDEVNKIMETKKESLSNHHQQHDVRSASTSTETTTPESNATSPSILDLLPPSRNRNPDAYDESAFHQFADIVDSIALEPGFGRRKRSADRLDEHELQSVVDWLLADHIIVKSNLPTLLHIVNTGALTHSQFDEVTLRNSLLQELEDQQAKFREHLGWNQAQFDCAIKGLLRLGQLCAKKATGLPAEVGWEKLKEMGLPVGKDHVQTYLYVTSTFSIRQTPVPLSSGVGSILDFLDSNSGSNPKDTTSNPTTDVNRQDPQPLPDSSDGDTIPIATEVALVHDLLFGASEQSTSIRVRRLVSQKKPAEAEKLLESNASEELRLRTYDPVFQCYLEQNDVASALKLYVKMKGEATVHLRPEIYVQLMAGIAENGFFQSNAPPISTALDLGYDPPSGPKLFDRLAQELADDAVEISAAAAKRLYNALQKGFADHNLKPLHLLQSLDVCNDVAPTSELVASRVSINARTGQCPRTGVQLRLINLDDEHKLKLKEGLQYLAAASFQERTGKSGVEGEQQLKDFGEWLAKRAEKPFTAIIDGPNVGYYFQNFEQGTFNFHQIQFVVDSLEAMGENVLVILPTKYTQNSFSLIKTTGRKRQTLTQKEREIRDNLIVSGKAYIVPPSSLDDYYWMYGSVAGQGEKWTRDQQYIAPNNPEGRWPGIRPMLVTNDQMRDHKLSLLEPRLFRRWYSNFIVNFTFSAFVGEKCADKEIGFSTADFYSREIQGNLVGGGDVDGRIGTAWHFPVADWETNETFCVRIPIHE